MASPVVRVGRGMNLLSATCNISKDPFLKAISRSVLSIVGELSSVVLDKDGLSDYKSYSCQL